MRLTCIISEKKIIVLEDELLQRAAVIHTTSNLKPISVSRRALCGVSSILMKTASSTGILHVYYSLNEVFWGISNLGYKT